ncbi:MAG: ankyrin repeat domain-containing protein [Gemmatimonadetes bacterium]|jgi:hypothetical protein|nr:ankyrin repeat domain-containing protein [Gemmatimonadota bacterium]
MLSKKVWLEALKYYGWPLPFAAFAKLLQGLWEADLTAVRAVIELHPEVLKGRALVATAAGPPGHWHFGQGGAVPVDVARDDQRAEVVRYLLEQGADAEGETHRKARPLHSAARFGLFETASALLFHGVAADPRDATGQTPLHRVARFGYREVAQLLLASGADPHAQDRRGTPRQIAKEKGLLWAELS